MLIPKVLLVNNTDLGGQSLPSLMTDCGGHELITARSCEEALHHVLAHEIAVVLLDARTAGMDGLAIAEAIHSHPRSASVPIIFVAAQDADEMSRLMAYRKGAVDHLVAPVPARILQAKVAVFVELARRNLQLQHQNREIEKLANALQAQRLLDLRHISEHRKTEDALRSSQEELRQLASYQERIKEDERKRIAREIHDELGQNLLALRLDVAMLHARTAGTHPRLNSKVHAVLEHIDTTMKAMRSIINNLRPSVLDLGLSAAIEWQVREFQRRTGIACELDLFEADITVDDNRATALFRVLQESLNNVFRHARASKTRIEMYSASGRLVMRVSDNGVGIFPGCRRKTNSFGLIGIKERIGALGGDLMIETEPDEGTALTVSIPLDAQCADAEGAAFDDGGTDNAGKGDQAPWFARTCWNKSM